MCSSNSHQIQDSQLKQQADSLSNTNLAECAAVAVACCAKATTAVHGQVIERPLRHDGEGPSPFESKYEGRFHRASRSGCWLWMGGMSSAGYPRIWHNGRKEQGNRLAYMMCCGPIPDGMVVCHRCDVPSCVNPDHLFLGSQSDNLIDCLNKGRRPLSTAASRISKTGVRGVHVDNNGGRSRPRYCAQIKFNKKKIHLGYYDTIELAAAAYRAAALRLHGESLDGR